MIAPTNLRRRTGIFQLREQAHNYTVRAARVSIPKFEWYLDLKRTRCKLMGTSNPPH
jgi:hypothetical protein